MSVTLQIDGKTAEIIVAGLLDGKAIKKVAAKADKAVAAGITTLYINTAEITGIDSGGITGLLHVRAGLLDRGMDLHVKAAPSEIAATLRLLKVNNLINLERKGAPT